MKSTKRAERPIVLRDFERRFRIEFERLSNKRSYNQKYR